jgi:hypothetical protein
MTTHLQPSLQLLNLPIQIPIGGSVGRDSSSSLPSSSTESTATTDVLSFIENLPDNRPSQFPSLPDGIADHLPPPDNGPASSFRSPLTMRRPLSSPKGARPTPLSSPEGAQLRPHSSEGAHQLSSSENTTSLPPSSPEGGFRRSSRLRKPVDRLNLLNSTRDINSKMLGMFDSTPCPKGSRQITFRKTDQPPRVTRESFNQQFLSNL